MGRFEEQVPVSFRPPLPLTLLAAMTCQSRLQAARDDSRSSSSIWHVFGTLLNVGYFALLRPGELLKLKAFDIMLPNSISLGAPFAVVRLDHPKSLRQGEAAVC